MYKLYGRNSSINVQKAAWAMGEIGLDFEWIDKDGTFRSIDTPAYRKINPARQIPTLDDDGHLIRQSNVIVRYLAMKYPDSALCPDDLVERAEAERWMDWERSDNNRNMVPVFWGYVRTKPEDRDPAAINEATENLHEDFRLLNDHLADRDYVTGDSFTMGDIPPGAATYRYYMLPIERPELPNLEEYYKRLQARPAYQQMVMVPLT